MNFFKKAPQVNKDIDEMNKCPWFVSSRYKNCNGETICSCKEYVKNLVTVVLIDNFCSLHGIHDEKQVKNDTVDQKIKLK